MNSLRLHPECSAGTALTVSAEIAATALGCRATFVTEGAIDQIVIPALQTAARLDNLWQTTCFEIFWQAEGSANYREFNLSPSTCWASYDFADVRVGMRDAPAEVVISRTISGERLQLTADIVSGLPLPARVALTAVVEDHDGVSRFWALDFDAGRPDFHSKSCRVLYLDGLS